MFELLVTENFDKAYLSLTKKNQELQKKIQKALKLLKLDPFYPSLKTHKANSKKYGEKWSSWAAEDIRIIWDYDTKDRLVIILLDLGKHSRSHKVYK